MSSQSSTFSSDSSTSDDERKRKRQVEEAISGVAIHSITSFPMAKKQKLSKRVEEQTGTTELLASTETQKFIAKKLSSLLDKQYEVVTPADDAHTLPSSSQISCIKLLKDSAQYISLTSPASSQAKHHKSTTVMDDTSSESETENMRLKEAAITFYKKKH